MSGERIGTNNWRLTTGSGWWCRDLPREEHPFLVADGFELYFGHISNLEPMRPRQIGAIPLTRIVPVEGSKMPVTLTFLLTSS